MIGFRSEKIHTILGINDGKGDRFLFWTDRLLFKKKDLIFLRIDYQSLWAFIF